MGIIIKEIREQIPHQATVLMMHALREAGKVGRPGVVQFLLEQIKDCDPQLVFDLMRYAMDGAATQTDPGLMDLLLGAVQNAFQATYPQQFLQLVQYAVNTTAKQGNLGLLKFLMDHTAAAGIPINYDDVFQQAVSEGQAETLLSGSIKCGARYENVILMLLQSIGNMPACSDSRLGSRQSLKNTAKLQLVKSYKQSDPALFAKLMAAVKKFFPEDIAEAPSCVGADVAM